MIERDDSAGLLQSKPSGAGALLIVPTPIGNLKDITLRALEALKTADVIACEDTRTSGKLMAHYDIHTPLISYHEHNGEKMRPKLIARLAQGQQVALISDAGTPLISDPGYKLVRAVQEAGFRVVPLPGACAAITALSGGGLPTDRFAFLGFLPTKTSARIALLEAVKAFDGTLVLYESPRRLLQTLQTLSECLGPHREVVLAREMTKHFEELLRLPLHALQAQLSQRESIKGEVVLLIGAGEMTAPDAQQVDAMLREALRESSTKQAAALIAQQTGLSKSELYSRALALGRSDEQS